MFEGSLFLHFVIPANAGTQWHVQRDQSRLGSRVRGNDEEGDSGTVTR